MWGIKIRSERLLSLKRNLESLGPHENQRHPKQVIQICTLVLLNIRKMDLLHLQAEDRYKTMELFHF
jgi:hypothetical protein